MHTITETGPASTTLYRGMALPAILLSGLLLRIFLLFTVENMLDCDESTVGVMALDIVESSQIPMFHYANAYNGGAALESYLAAVGFFLFGSSAILLKMTVLLLWMVTGVFFMDLIQRALSFSSALLAMVLFSLSTLFVLEWSRKGRGGFMETVLISPLFLWLFYPPDWLLFRPRFRLHVLGLLGGLGYWMSEMTLLFFVSTVLATSLFKRNSLSKTQALFCLLSGLLIGLIPVLCFNFTHDWINFKQSVIYECFFGTKASSPLSVSDLFRSIQFTGGHACWLILAGTPILLYQVLSDKIPARRQLGRLVFIQTVVYFTVYWYTGYRALDIAPSRVLIAIYPSVAILAGYGIEAIITHGRVRVLVFILSGIWCIVSLNGVREWIRSDRPREWDSWRGNWSLARGEAIVDQLSLENTGVIYTDYWTYSSLLYVIRSHSYQETTPQVMPLLLSSIPSRHALSQSLPHHLRQSNAAFVLVENSPLLQSIENIMDHRRWSYQRATLGHHVILSNLPVTEIHSDNGFPVNLIAEARPPLPENHDSFN